MTRRDYFADSLSFSFTMRVPHGWIAAAGGHTAHRRTPIGAWAWIIRRCWRISGDDLRLARFLEDGLDG